MRSAFEKEEYEMGQILWEIKQAATKLIAILLVGAVGFGGYQLYQEGAFRGGVAHATKTILRKVPYVGSRFKHFFASSSQRTAGRHSVSYRNSRKKGLSQRRAARSHRAKTRHYRRRR